MTGNLFDAPEPAASIPLFTAHCDGGSRGNPGPAGYGAVIEDAQGRIVARLSEFLGVQTNNYAEYHGLLAVLRWSLESGVKHLRVVSDSEKAEAVSKTARFRNDFMTAMQALPPS